MWMLSGTLIAILALIALACEMTRSAATLGALAYIIISRVA